MLGYKNAVEEVYQKLAEARLEEQQNCQYPLHGDVSVVMVSTGIFEYCKPR